MSERTLAELHAEDERYLARLRWLTANPATIDALIAGTLVAVPVEASNETCIAILEALQRLRSGEDNRLSSRVLYRAMITEHTRGHLTKLTKSD